MKSLCASALVILGLWGLASPVHGQFYPPMIFDPPLMKFLPEGAAFSATMEVSSGVEAYRWPVHVAFLNRMTRVEMDIAKMEGGRRPEGWADYVKQMQRAGSAEAVSIFNPDRQRVFILVPQLKAYTEQPIAPEALAQLGRRPKAKTVELGIEQVDGRPATKSKMSYTVETMDVWRTWESPEAVVWTAKEVSPIPLRIEVHDSAGRTNASLSFKEVQSTAPALELFVPPKSFVKCDEESLMKRIMKKWPKGK